MPPNWTVIYFFHNTSLGVKGNKTLQLSSRLLELEHSSSYSCCCLPQLNSAILVFLGPGTSSDHFHEHNIKAVSYIL